MEEKFHCVWVRSKIGNALIRASHTDTVPDFNEKILSFLSKDFPPDMQLKINYLKVKAKKNGKYYRLADNLRIFSVFQLEKEDWCLRAHIPIISNRSSYKKSTKSHLKSDSGFDEMERVPLDQTVMPHGTLKTFVEFQSPDPKDDANVIHNSEQQATPDRKEEDIVETSLQGTNDASDVQEIVQDDEIEMRTRVVAKRLFPTETGKEFEDDNSNANTWNPSESLPGSGDSLVNGNVSSKKSIGSVVGTSTKRHISMLEISLQSKKPKLSPGWSSSDETSKYEEVVPDTPEHLINNHGGSGDSRGTRRLFLT